MVKRLLSVMALGAIVAVSASAASIAEKAVNSFSFTPQPVEQITAQVQPKATLARVAPKKATTKADLLGNYVAMFDCYSYSNSTMSASDPFYCGSGVELTAGTGDTILMPNLLSGDGYIKMVFDATNQTLTIPQQVVYSSSTYGDCYLYATTESKTPIEMTIGDGAIYSQYYVYMYIASGDYAGYRLGGYYTLSLYEANGYVEAYSASDKGTYQWPALIAQDETTYDIVVYNFADGEAPDTMTYIGSGQWNIGYDYVVDLSATYGNFYPYSATVSDGSDGSEQGYTLNEDSIIVAKAVNDQEIDWEGWVLYSPRWQNTNGKNYYYDYFTYGKLVYEQNFLGYTGIVDVTANTNRTVASTSYYNLMGVESATPFDGLNIVVTKYTDGTKSAVKVIK